MLRIISHFAFSVLCFQEHLKLYYNSGSTREKCPSVVSEVSPELTPTDVWIIHSEVVLGKDCNYTVYVASVTESYISNSNGDFSISK